MFLFVDVENKLAELLLKSVVTEVMSNMVIDNANASVTIVSSNEPAIAHVIDWDNIKIAPIAND